MPRPKKPAVRKPPVRERVAVTFTLAPGLLEHIDAIAQRENRPRSRMIEVMLAEAVQSYQQRAAA